jgi:Uma2 family endonuclease
MDTTTPDVKLTYDDLLRLPDDDLRHELIDGEHYVTASPNLRHQEIVGNLLFAIRSWLEDHPIGRVYVASVDVVLTPTNVVVPDLLYMSHARAADIRTPQAVRGVPELLIEILSPSTRKRDEMLKRNLYECEGVAEYWIIDPSGEHVHVYRRSGTAFDRPETLSGAEGGVLTTPLLPGLQIALSRIFAS